VLRYRELADFGRGLFSGVGWIGVLLVLGVLVFLDTQEIPPFVRFAMVFMLFLLAIRAGLACHRALQEGSDRKGRLKSRIEALGLLVIPLGVLLVFMLFDFGLGLVFFVPMFVTVLLAARIDRLPASLALASVALVAGVGAVAWSVLEPSLTELRTAPDIPSFSRAFENVGNPLIDGLRAAGLSGPITRATVRSMAASDPDLLEEALAFAAPSEALFAAAPSREQVWGGRAYAASGWTGTGFAGTTLLGRGVPTAVSYAENTFSVYVLSEHGALGGLAVLATYVALLVVVAVWLFRVRATVQETAAGRAVLAMVVGGVLWLTIPAAYVAASNLGLVPLTGQNMPFLGLNSWADVVLVSGLSTGIVLALASLDGPAADTDAEGRVT
jgi:cell division protein FtsW (lipid II flippase)